MTNKFDYTNVDNSCKYRFFFTKKRVLIWVYKNYAPKLRSFWIDNNKITWVGSADHHFITKDAINYIDKIYKLKIYF
jgi:hypothetical protein